MGKSKHSGSNTYTYNDQGTMEVSQQILDSYNSGVIPQSEMKRRAPKSEKK